MKRKVRIKKVPLAIFGLFLVALLSFALKMDREMKAEDPYTPPVMKKINDTIPVINENNYIMTPYRDQSVTIGKSYYDYKGEDEQQQNSLILYDNTYYQNTGIDYIGENVFDVLAVMDGTVIQVKDEENMGKEIKIEHKNGLITIYQSLSEIDVKKDDMVKQGQVIGKSGTNELDKDLGNHLHFEIYENGKNVNPEKYLNKEYKKEN